MAMGFTDVIWIFFLISAIQPIIRQKLLEASRLRLLKRFERRRGSRVIALIHRQETMSLLGFPVMRYIDIHDSEEVLRAIKLTDRTVPVDLIVHTPGGLVLAADQIARAFRRHQGKVTVFVPHYAMSGGTLLALAADEIVMDENAVLGPVDPQIGQSPAASLLTVLVPHPVPGPRPPAGPARALEASGGSSETLPRNLRGSSSDSSGRRRRGRGGSGPCLPWP